MILMTNTGVKVVNCTWSGCVLYTDQWGWASIMIMTQSSIAIVVLH